MDARDYFKTVVPNYIEFVERPNDFRLWGTPFTVAEYLRLHRRGYPPDVSRNERRQEAQMIRNNNSDLVDLQICADTIKHVRVYQGDGLTLSSTGIDPHDQATWHVNGKHLSSVAHKALRNVQRNSRIKVRDLRPAMGGPTTILGHSVRRKA
jgi:hypothetical protein